MLLMTISIVIGLILAVAIAQTILQKKFIFLKPLSPETRDAYIAVAIAGAAAAGLHYLSSGTITSFEVAGIRTELAQVRKEVGGLAEQIEALYQSQITEKFDATNWNRLSFSKNAAGWFDASVELEHVPILRSLQITRGPLGVAPDKMRIDGRRLTFQTYIDEFDNDPIFIHYYPQR